MVKDPTPIEVATDVAAHRLARYEMEREDRMAQYRLTWERLWRNAKAAEEVRVAQRRDSLWRVK